jgi:ribonuclease BN (tRNA processing enzyme)
MVSTRFLIACGVAMVMTTASVGLLTSQTQPAPPPAATAIMFGVGSPNLTAERSGTSIGIAAGGTLYIFDAGPGVERRIMEARSKLETLRIRRLGPVFITHLHRDHTAGLASLLAYHSYGPAGLTLSLASDRTPMTVYGPAPEEDAKPGVEIPEWDRSITELMSHLIAAFGGGPVNTVKIHAGVVFRDSNLTVSAFEAVHIPGSFGYRIQTNDRTIVISGDTIPVDALVAACDGCDILFHEAYGLTDDPTNPTAAYHTSATSLGEVAKRARPKHLVVYHDVRIDRQQGLALISKAFSGKVTFANDLDVF